MWVHLVNAAAIVVGVLFGLLLKKGIPEKISSSLMTALGFCVAFIGLRGLNEGEQTLLLIFAMVFGVVVGTALDLDGKMLRLGRWVESRFSHGKESGKNQIAEGFVNGTLLFCIGAMAIVGSLNVGLNGDGSTILTKSLIDGVTSILYGAQFGIGTAFSALPVLVYQGLITLLANLVSPYLTDAVIAEINCCGSLLILMIGLNMIGITKIKVMNFVPAILFSALFAVGYYAVFPI